MNDTIFALSSGALPAGIAVIRISGPGAEGALQQLAGPLGPPRQLVLKTLTDPGGATLDRALVVRFPAPATVTGEPLVELHCHGGRAVVARLLDVLGDMNRLRHAEPGEFTRRAVLNGRLDLAEAEGLADLLSAETEWQRRAAVESAGGGLSRQIGQWRERLVLLAAKAEAAIDYVDEEETELDLAALISDANALRGEWLEWLAAPRAELLHDGLRVVFAGPPNAGKSSLFNALIGADKAIVTDVPGTTRDLIEARVDWNGLPLVLIDTAGLRESNDAVERIGVTLAAEAQATADILLWLGEPAETPGKAICVHARSDVRGDAPPEAFATSVRTGDGIGPLRRAIIERAKALLPPADRAPLNRRQAALLADATTCLADVRSGESLLTAEALRQALHFIDRVTGKQSTDDVLDALFGRFCLGK